MKQFFRRNRRLSSKLPPCDYLSTDAAREDRPLLATTRQADKTDSPIETRDSVFLRSRLRLVGVVLN